jgi:hypothetical protein
MVPEAARGDAPNAVAAVPKHSTRIDEETMKTRIAPWMATRMASLGLGLATLAGVAAAQSAQPVHDTAPPDTSANAVTVQNDRKVPVTIYMDWGPFDRRLGIVPPLQTATLPLPAWAVRDHETIRLFAHPEGDPDDLATEEFPLESPGRIAMMVPPQGGLPKASTDAMSAVIPPDELADATLTVDNPRNTPVTVFAEQGDFDVRLGQVPAHGHATLQFPKSVVLADESIQVFVHPEGGADLSSDTLHVRKGEHLGLRVPPR